LTRRRAPEKIAPADDQTNFDPGGDDGGDLAGQLHHARRINAESRLAGERFAAQLQEDSPIPRHECVVGRRARR